MIRILFAIVLLAFGSAWAKTTVIYVNGLANVDPVALHINQAKFLDIIREGNLFWRQDLIFDPFDNIAISEFDSREEAAVQIFISKSAIGAATTNSVVDLSSYTFHLGSAYRVLDSEIGYAKRVYIKTKKLAEKILSATQVGTVIIIGHSQGALYVEAALAYLVRGGPENGYARFPSEKVATLNIASPAFTNGGYEYINVDNDENLYRLSAKSLVVQLGWGNVQKSTTSLCIKPCADGLPLSNDRLYAFNEDQQFHSISTYLNPILFSTKDRLPLRSLIASKVFNRINVLRFLERGKSVSGVQIVPEVPKTLILGAFSRFFPYALVSDVPHQESAALYAFTNGEFTVRVDGVGFDGNEAVDIIGSMCSAGTVKYFGSYFTQKCIGGNVAGSNYSVKVYDRLAEMDILLPDQYKYMSLIAPVLAPNAPTLSDLGSGTIRVSWSAVAGASGYVVLRDGTDIATLGAVAAYDDSGRSYGASVCYRVRAISNGVLSDYSPQRCITPAAPQCLNQWSTGTTPPGGSESTSQSCPAGQTGSITLSHTCGFDGLWGGTSTSNNCIVNQTLSPPTGFSAARYTQGATKGIRLTWNAVSGADSYLVYKLGVNGIYAPLGNQTSFIDILNLKSGTSYCYTVRAQSGSRQSGDSDVACSLAP